MKGIRAIKGILMEYSIRLKLGRLLPVLMLVFVWGVGPVTPTAFGQVADRGASAKASASARVASSGSPGSAATKHNTHALTRMDQGSQIYFAEGYTGQGPVIDFSEHLSILNTNPVTATGQIDYFLGGDITATSVLNQGATFTITLPVHQPK